MQTCAYIPAKYQVTGIIKKLDLYYNDNNNTEKLKFAGCELLLLLNNHVCLHKFPNSDIVDNIVIVDIVL